MTLRPMLARMEHPSMVQTLVKTAFVLSLYPHTPARDHLTDLPVRCAPHRLANMGHSTPV
ncbi:hypothetical protein RB213_005119, partial [Colletotrichum asianum]